MSRRVAPASPGEEAQALDGVVPTAVPQQQSLRLASSEWRPGLRGYRVVTIFAVGGVAAFAVGAGFIVAASNVAEVIVSYDINLEKWVEIEFDIPERMEPPIKAFYELHRYHQNHRRYAKSFCEDQLSHPGRVSAANKAGEDELNYRLYKADVTLCRSHSDCTPEALDHQGRVKYPCGLVANTTFNDTFYLERFVDGGYERVEIDDSPKAVAWASDVDERYENYDPRKVVPYVVPDSDGLTIEAPLEEVLDMWAFEVFPPVACEPADWSKRPLPFATNSEGVRTGVPRPARVLRERADGANVSVVDCSGVGTKTVSCTFDPPCEGDWRLVPGPNKAGYGVENGHLMAWMRPAALPSFRKVWGELYTPLEAGKYRLTVSSLFPVDAFGGSKAFVLATTGWSNGKNFFLGGGYLACGVFSLLYCLLLTSHLRRVGRERDEPQVLDWLAQ